MNGKTNLQVAEEPTASFAKSRWWPMLCYGLPYIFHSELAPGFQQSLDFFHFFVQFLGCYSLLSHKDSKICRCQSLFIWELLASKEHTNTTWNIISQVAMVVVVNPYVESCVIASKKAKPAKWECCHSSKTNFSKQWLLPWILSCHPGRNTCGATSLL